MSLAGEFDEIRAGIGRVAAHGVALPIDDIMLARKVKHLGMAITARLHHLLQPHGLVETDFSALMQLFGSPGHSASPGELCNLTAQQPTNMTRIANALVRKRLATRAVDPRDRRRVVLRLTARGTRLARTLMPQLGAEVRAALSALDLREKRQLDHLLQRLATSLDTHLGHCHR